MKIKLFTLEILQKKITTKINYYVDIASLLRYVSRETF